MRQAQTVFSETYVRIILALAPWVVCLAFALDRKLWSKHLQLVAPVTATFFSISVFQPVAQVWGCLPWLFLTLWVAASRLFTILRAESSDLADWALVASVVYLPVGGVWALFDQLGFQPLNFSGIIVLLTGVHFHYAGFALPRLTGLWLQKTNGKLVYQLATLGVIAGVPLVAIGITTSQLQIHPAIEVTAVSILAFSAFTVSIGQATWAWSASMPTFPKLLFIVGGAALAVGMVLAMTYGWRSVFPVSWATIPAMYAIHGTLNSLGFCLPGFLAWHSLKSSH